MSSLTEEQRKTINAEAERIKRLLKPTNVGRKDMKAYVGALPLRTCKLCGDPLEHSFKSPFCTRCYFRLKKAREKKRRYY